MFIIAMTLLFSVQVSKDHPRYKSLVIREMMSERVREGIVSQTGLIAHGRGEAFDYLLGEVTTPPALAAERAATACLLEAGRPVISVNGNTAALSAKDIVLLSKATGAKIEVNLFHRTEERADLVCTFMEAAGAQRVLGRNPDALLSGITSDRAKCSKEGIFSADAVLVPLEDGDRTEALIKAGKKVIVVDLNPLSRSARAATITIVDEVTRAIPNMLAMVPKLSHERERRSILAGFDNSQNRKASLDLICARLRAIGSEGKG